MLSYSDISRYVQMTAHWPLDIWEQFENDWLMNRVLPAARRNPLYGQVETIRDLQDLEEYPTIGWDEIDQLVEKKAISFESLVTAEPAVSWYSSGSSGRRKVIWSSEEDLDMYRRVLGRRLYNMGINGKARALILGAPGGYTSAILPKFGYDWLAETVCVPFTEIAEHRDKILSGPFDVMVTWTPVAYLLATKDGSKRLLGTFEKTPIFSEIFTELKHRKLKQALGFCQVIVGGDFRTDFQDKAMTDFYGRPSCLAYVSTEIVSGGSECLDRTTRYHTGEMHPAFDDAIPLIIPLSEMEKERLNPEYEPKKLLFSRAPVGMIGEAVFTVNADCFVRLNYRTGDMIRKGRDKSDCPNPLPTFEVLGRVGRKVSVPELGLEGYEGTVVKIAVAPFCVKYMWEVMSMVRREGTIKDWFMSLTYVKRKPRLTLFIEAEDVKNQDKLVEEILQTIRENIELEALMFATKMGMADLKIEFLPSGTLENLQEKKLRKLGTGRVTMGQLKIPKLILTTDFVKEQGLF